MNCASCNEPLPADAKFCPRCGTRVSQGSGQGVFIPEDIAKRATGFAGRLWVLDDVVDWLDHGTEPFMLITGEPGSGKTTLAAWLAGAGPLPEDSDAQEKLIQVRGAWKAAHFCIAQGQDGTLDPKTFTRSLVRQLSDRFEDFADDVLKTAAPGVTINASVKENLGEFTVANIGTLYVNSNPQDAFNTSLREPLKAFYERHPSLRIIILVDGLDEALKIPDPNIVTLLAGSRDIHAGVRFLFTSRNESKVLDQFPQKRHLNLSDPAHTPAVSTDLRAYVDQRLKESALQQQLIAAGSPPGIEDQIVEHAAGNFLYARFLLDEIASGKRTFDSLAGLPRGLYDLYSQFLDRLMPEMAGSYASSPRWAGKIQPLLGCLSVAIPAAPEELLHRWLALPDGDVHIFLNDLIQLTESEPGGVANYRLYHFSMTEFLASRSYQSDGVLKPNRYFTPPVEQHQRIIDYYLSNFAGSGQDWQDCDSYGLRHLVSHMKERLDLLETRAEKDQQAQALFQLVLNKSFRDAQQNILGDLYTTLADLRTALSVALKRDGLLTALECAATYRSTKHSLTITSATFKAAQAGDFDRALQLSRHYDLLPNLVEKWGRALQLFLAWQAAEQGKPQAVAQIMASAKHLPSPQFIWIQDLWDSLLVRTALALARTAGDGRDALAWLAELAPGQDLVQKLQDLQTQPVDPAQQAARQMLLQDKLNDFKKLVDEGDPEAISVAPLLDDEKVGTQAADLRDLLVALADTDEGRSAIDETLKLVLPNPYPRYRDIGLVALGVACLAVPEADWVRQHLQLILETALNQEGVTFAFNLPAILIAEAEKRNLPAQKPSDYQKLSDYIAAAKTDDNNWGTAMRAHSAHAVAQFWQGNTSEAFLELGKASRLNTGFAGYGTLTLLSLANCYMEFGEPDRASASIWGSNQNASLLLAKAEALASMVRDEQFRSERRQLVQDFRAWSIASTPDIKGVLTAFSRMPDPDTFRLYIDHVTARWANPGSPYRESIKDLVPAALANATTLDTVLGRLFGLSLGRLSNDDLVKAIGLCADKLLVDLPGK